FPRELLQNWLSFKNESTDRREDGLRKRAKRDRVTWDRFSLAVHFNNDSEPETVRHLRMVRGETHDFLLYKKNFFPRVFLDQEKAANITEERKESFQLDVREHYNNIVRLNQVDPGSRESLKASLTDLVLWTIDVGYSVKRYSGYPLEFSNQIVNTYYKTILGDEEGSLAIDLLGVQRKVYEVRSVGLPADLNQLLFKKVTGVRPHVAEMIAPIYQRLGEIKLALIAGDRVDARAIRNDITGLYMYLDGDDRSPSPIQHQLEKDTLQLMMITRSMMQKWQEKYL
ncbi:MAG: hypothetical protein V4731_11865, partial [Pseudomonadota bacterium]